MIHLIYICSAATTPSEQDLVELLNQARVRNWSLNITGMLLYDSDTFIQVLEGEKRDIHRVFNSIRRDSRVGRVVTLVDERIHARSFPNWSMGFKNLKDYDPEQLIGFSEIFSGKVDPMISARKQELAVDLLMSFAEDAESLRPASLG